jgi:hypothetical protein
METAMRIPVWLTLGIALVAFLWGGYRIYLALRSEDRGKDHGSSGNNEPEDGAGRARAGRRRGLGALTRRTHLLFGVVYLLLGVLLVATTFGYNPIGSMFGPRTEVPDKAAAPSKPGSVPSDQLPPVKPGK